MIKEALQYLIGLGNVGTLQVGNQQYATGDIKLVKEATTQALTVRNLSGLVDYLKANYDNLDPVLVQVVSPTEVNVYSTFNRDKNRNHLLTAEALLPRIAFENFHDAERFNILLQSNFVDNEHRAALLKVAGNVKSEKVVTVGDDGTAQQITLKQGVATVADAVVPNPVNLKPFRTFVEITQPESAFVFRMQDGPRMALFEADGGAWKIEAIHAIRDYLNEQLADEIAQKKVTIIA